MIKEYDAIVVGGGIAGLTSAAYLLKYGYKVLLCEKEENLGGLVGTFWESGFAFDWGIRAFENSGILFPMLKNLGIELEFINNSVSIGLGKEWVTLDSMASIDQYFQMLARQFPDNHRDIDLIAKEIKKVMGYMEVIYGIDNPLFLENMNDWEYLLKTLLPWLIKYQIKMHKAGKLTEPVDTYLRRFTSNQALIDVIIQHFFKKTPTFFALSYFGLYLDYCYPLGGTGTLIKKMTEYVINHKGEIKTSTAIKEIDAMKHIVKTSHQEVYHYKKLIWAANQRSLYQGISGIHHKEFNKQKALVSQSRGGDSILTVYLATNLPKEYFANICGAHAFYTPVKDGISSLQPWQEQNKTTELIAWVKDYLATTTYEISCPTLRDENLSPKGKTSIIISTLFDYHLDLHFANLGESQRLKEICITKIIEVLDHSIFPDWQQEILFTRCATPRTIENKTSNVDGAITGWSFTNPIMPSENRFKKMTQSIKTPIKDVYQCGQWSFSPAGMPVSILTGKLTADAVRKERKREKI